MGSRAASIEQVWSRITGLAGQEFRTMRGLPFTYTVRGEVLRPSRTNYPLAMSNFAKALALVPIEGPGVISDLVRGSAYVWAVLHDSRVRLQEW